ncbi:MAG: DUF3783 domain-containing protein [Dictyoglomi bacterium]|jgi:hypothetical protein|nr:DUF3783 domain-containing protein [Dictyoglomota bacterium]
MDKYPIFIMHGVPREKLSDVMQAVRSVLGKDVIFSITTETNLQWKVQDLIEELISEHEHMKKFRSKNDNEN